jgi:hydroxyquinol 1,2-dioxygenase
LVEGSDHVWVGAPDVEQIIDAAIGFARRVTTTRTLLDTVLESIAGPDERLRQGLVSLVEHLHTFVDEVRPTEEEWLLGLDFLRRTGQACTERRNEVILLSDMLGLTSAVDDVNHVGPANMTPSSVEGPFHAPAKPREMGSWIAEGPERDRGEAAVVRGVVTGCDGKPLSGAVIDIWQANDDGRYDTQDPDQELGNLRALLTTGSDGEYWFRTIVPSSYPVPTDGPVGELLRAVGRHPMRPAHIHVRVDAPGYRPLTTHLFVAGDEYLGSDAAFAVKAELVEEFTAVDDGRFGLAGPFREAVFDLRLVPVDWTPARL